MAVKRRKKKGSASTAIIVVIVLAVLVVAAVVFAVAYSKETANIPETDDTDAVDMETEDTSDTTTLPVVSTEDTSDDTTSEPEPAEHIEITDLTSSDSADLANGEKATFAVTAPKLVSETYGESADKFNEIITTEIEAFKNEFAKEIASAATEENTSPDLTIEFKMSYEVCKASEGVVSVMLKKYAYLGGAHGGTSYKAVNFDLNSAQSIDMQYVTGVPKEEYTPFIKNKVLEQMRADTEGTYFSTDDKALDDSFDDTQFVICDTGVKVFFQEYDIAPYAAGYQIFEIPYNELIELSSY